MDYKPELYSDDFKLLDVLFTIHEDNLSDKKCSANISYLSECLDFLIYHCKLAIPDCMK